MEGLGESIVYQLGVEGWMDMSQLDAGEGSIARSSALATVMGIVVTSTAGSVKFTSLSFPSQYRCLLLLTGSESLRIGLHSSHLPL